MSGGLRLLLTLMKIHHIEVTRHVVKVVKQMRDYGIVTGPAFVDGNKAQILEFLASCTYAKRAATPSVINLKQQIVVKNATISHMDEFIPDKHLVSYKINESLKSRTASPSPPVQVPYVESKPTDYNPSQLSQAAKNNVPVKSTIRVQVPTTVAMTPTEKSDVPTLNKASKLDLSIKEKIIQTKPKPKVTKVKVATPKLKQQTSIKRARQKKQDVVDHIGESIESLESNVFLERLDAAHALLAILTVSKKAISVNTCERVTLSASKHILEDG